MYFQLSRAKLETAMKKFALALVAAVIGTGNSFAADIALKARPAPPTMDPAISWSGFYVGVNAGWADQGDRRDLTFTNSVGNATPPTPGLRASGGFGGGQVGYNWQRGAAVFGLEADIEGAGIRDNIPTILIVPSATLTASRKIDYFGTVRGRLGLAWNNALFYITGGFAYADVENVYLINATTSNSFTPIADKSLQTGYVIGAGGEWLFKPQWSLKAEYQYINLGSYILSASVVPANGNFLTANSTRNDFHTVRIGLNYHFGGPVIAKY
jgi:outer membrane immunogenic protein